MDDLIKWLRDQLDHDELVAFAGDVEDADEVIRTVARFRAVVEELEAAQRSNDELLTPGLQVAIRIIAAVAYASRPGYREEWRP